MWQNEPTFSCHMHLEVLHDTTCTILWIRCTLRRVVSVVYLTVTYGLRFIIRNIVLIIFYETVFLESFGISEWWVREIPLYLQVAFSTIQLSWRHRVQTLTRHWQVKGLYPSSWQYIKQYIHKTFRQLLLSYSGKLLHLGTLTFFCIFFSSATDIGNRNIVRIQKYTVR
jgi:hypothetical protein